MFIYKLTCSETNKVYYGATKNTPKYRKARGHYKCACKDFINPKIETIEKFNLNINVNLNRNNICKEILNHVQEYNLEYLYEENKFKKLSIKEKDNVILIAKKIKSFVKSGLDLNKNLYNSNDDAISDAIYIGQYGDISSVRKAITLLNTALNIQIPIIISENLKKSLDEKVEIKKKVCLHYKLNTVNFMLIFNNY